MCIRDRAIAILNARIAPDNDKMIREIDHKVVINGKPYFLAHAYTCLLYTSGILNYALSNDNCLYDLTLHGAQELNAKIGAVENVYY